MTTVSTERLDARIAKLREQLSSIEEMKAELKQLEAAKKSLDEIASLLPSRAPRKTTAKSTGGRKRGRPRKSAE